MVGKRLDIYQKTECLIFSAVYGDEAALKRFGISERTLRNYRRLARDESSELAKTYREYASAVHSEPTIPVQFLDLLNTQMKTEVMITSDHFMELAARIPKGDASALRALTAHMKTLMSQITALEVISRLFGDQQDGATRLSDYEDHFSSKWSVRSGDSSTAEV